MHQALVLTQYRCRYCVRTRFLNQLSRLTDFCSFVLQMFCLKYFLPTQLHKLTDANGIKSTRPVTMMSLKQRFYSILNGFKQLHFNSKLIDRYEFPLNRSTTLTPKSTTSAANCKFNWNLTQKINRKGVMKKKCRRISEKLTQFTMFFPKK